jgi:hypothetical protein
MAKKKKKVPQYIVTVSDDYEDFDNVICTSFVDDPATQKLFAVFSSVEVKEQLAFKVTLPSPENEQSVNEKDGKFERIVSGVWFMPDIDYPRMDGNGVFSTNITRPELQKAVSNYVKAGASNNFNVMHDGEMVEGLRTMEIWVLNDHSQRSPILNNSIEDLGYKKENIPLGTVFMTVFIENKEFFENNISSGKLKGFSIEAFFNLEEKNTEMANVKQKAMFAAYGLNQETGEFLTAKGALSFSAEGVVKLGEKVVSKGTIKLSTGFSVIVRDGKVADYGFENEGEDVGTIDETNEKPEVILDDAATAAAATAAATEAKAAEVAAEAARVATQSATDKAVEAALKSRDEKAAAAKAAADKAAADTAKEKELADAKAEIDALKKSKGITPAAKIADDYDKDVFRKVVRGGVPMLVLKR